MSWRESNRSHPASKLGKGRGLFSRPCPNSAPAVVLRENNTLFCTLVLAPVSTQGRSLVWDLSNCVAESVHPHLNETLIKPTTISLQWHLPTTTSLQWHLPTITSLQWHLRVWKAVEKFWLLCLILEWSPSNVLHSFSNLVVLVKRKFVNSTWYRFWQANNACFKKSVSKTAEPWKISLLRLGPKFFLHVPQKFTAKRTGSERFWTH